METERNNKQNPLLQLVGLSKDFRVKGKKGTTIVHAVDNVSFSVYPGETFGLVGESGCGKTTTGRMICCLTEASSGNVFFQDRDLFSLSSRDRRKIRKDLQMVFQDPFASLDPRITVGKTIEEPLIVNHIGSRESRRKAAEEMLEIVGLQKSYYSRFPHEFSGGQRQRIGIARSLVIHPKLVVCDEPVSALDVSVQSQILNLLVELQKEFGVTYIFIAHGLNVVQYISDWIGVMYLGRLVEIIRSQDLFTRAAHPYTQALISAVPIPNPEKKASRIILEGDIPSPSSPPSGCHFHTRCPYAKDICREKAPEVRQLSERAMVSCHFPLTGL